MPRYLPNILHFVLFFDLDTYELSENIVNWAWKNPQYRVMVWTNGKSEESVIEYVQKRMRRVKTGEGDDAHKVFIDVVVHEREAGGTLVVGYVGDEEDKVPKLKVSVRSLHNSFIRRDRREAFEEKFFPEVKDKRGKKLAEDFLGLCALEVYGGLYVDNTVDSTTSLPSYLQVKYDIGFTRYRRTELALTTAVVGALKNCRKMTSLVDFIQEVYRTPKEIAPDYSMRVRAAKRDGGDLREFPQTLDEYVERKRKELDFSVTNVAIDTPGNLSPFESSVTVIESSALYEVASMLPQAPPPVQRNFLNSFSSSLKRLVRGRPAGGGTLDESADHPLRQVLNAPIYADPNVGPLHPLKEYGGLSEVPEDKFKPLDFAKGIPPDLGLQRAIPELIFRWFMSFEVPNAEEDMVVFYDLVALNGIKLVYDESNLRFIPPLEFAEKMAF